jgi:hypothetical protein
MSPGALVSFMLYQQNLSGAFSMMGDGEGLDPWAWLSFAQLLREIASASQCRGGTAPQCV